LACFAVGGLVHGPFIPLTYALFQSITSTKNLPSVLAARSAALTVATPLGTAIGGPIVASLGARWTLTASGAATVLLAVIATPIWQRGRSQGPVLTLGSDGWSPSLPAHVPALGGMFWLRRRTLFGS